MQETINWEELRRKKTEEYGTKYKNWSWILVRQYKDRTHFLFELLQNAEDAGASQVTLLLDRNAFAVEHDGTLFTKRDVVSITDVESTKGGAGSIGKFGIGFKSVYAYTTKPRIYSGKYSFEIRDFLFPHEISPIPLGAGLTRIEIPFNRHRNDTGSGQNVTPEQLRKLRETAFAEIKQALLRQINETSLLFLNRIQTLEIQIQDGDTVHMTREVRDLDGAKGSIIRYKRTAHGHTDLTQEFSYWVFADQRVQTAVAFLHRGNEVVPVSNPPVFTFFPTDKESHQSFFKLHLRQRPHVTISWRTAKGTGN